MTRKMLFVETTLIVVVSVVIVRMYPGLPDTVTTHWGSDMRANGSSPKWVLFLLGPGLMAGLALLTFLGPWLSPRRFETTAFKATFEKMLLVALVAAGYFSVVIVWSSSDHAFDAGRWIAMGACVLVAVLGNMMGKVRRNFFLGIRTPWALASERVWNATHRFGAKAFVVGGMVGVLFLALRMNSIAVYALVTAALAPVLYSLVYYKRLQGRGEL